MGESILFLRFDKGDRIYGGGNVYYYAIGWMITPRRDTRNISLFRLSFGARPENKKRTKGIDPYKLEDVIAALRTAADNGKAVIYYNLQGNWLENPPPGDVIRVVLEEIRDELTDTGGLHSYVLRFSYLHPKSADRGKRDIKTKAQTTLSIDPGEAGEVGAHLVIGPVETSGPRAGFSRCALEQMPGLSRSKIVSLINDVAQSCMAPAARPTFEYREGKGKKSRIVVGSTCLKLTSHAEKSESLDSNLKNGTLKRLRFLGPPTKTDELNLDGIERLEHEISASVKSTYRRGERARALIREAIQYAKKHKLKAKIDIDTENEGNTLPKTRELDLDKDGLADQLFARQVPITYTTDEFPELYSEIHKELVIEMKQLIDRSEFWL